MSDVITRRIEEVASPHGGRLGRHVEHDPASKDHAFGLTVPPSALVAVSHVRHGDPFNQGDLGSCTGNATAGAINTEPFYLEGRDLVESDAVAIYELASALDNIPGAYPPDDTGSSGLAAAKAAVEKGYISAYKHAFSVEEALAALQQTPLITGVSWYESFDTPNPDGLVSIAGQVRGGHEFEIIGFEPGQNLDDGIVEAVNSWGTGWGKNGRFYFTVATWRQLLGDQGDATILVK